MHGRRAALTAVVLAGLAAAVLSFAVPFPGADTAFSSEGPTPEPRNAALLLGPPEPLRSNGCGVCHGGVENNLLARPRLTLEKIEGGVHARLQAEARIPFLELRAVHVLPPGSTGDGVLEEGRWSGQVARGQSVDVPVALPAGTRHAVLAVVASPLGGEETFDDAFRLLVTGGGGAWESTDEGPIQVVTLRDLALDTPVTLTATLDYVAGEGAGASVSAHWVALGPQGALLGPLTAGQPIDLNWTLPADVGEPSILVNVWPFYDHAGVPYSPGNSVDFTGFRLGPGTPAPVSVPDAGAYLIVDETLEAPPSGFGWSGAGSDVDLWHGGRDGRAVALWFREGGVNRVVPGTRALVVNLTWDDVSTHPDGWHFRYRAADRFNFTAPPATDEGDGWRAYVVPLPNGSADDPFVHETGWVFEAMRPEREDRPLLAQHGTVHLRVEGHRDPGDVSPRG